MQNNARAFLFFLMLQSKYMKVIYLGAGSFWVMEAVYKKVKGVTEVIPGYMGGTVPQPSHEIVATGTTGHAEVVQVTYDESIIATEDVLNIFFALHDPATPNHPPFGNGTQYRAVIFYTEEYDGEAADPGNGSRIGMIERVIAKVQETMPEGSTVSVYIMSVQDFYPADESHYDYYNQHINDAYSICAICPALEAIKTKFPNHFQ
jgi:peptide-methionine (S)-S-oxide reductase